MPCRSPPQALSSFTSTPLTRHTVLTPSPAASTRPGREISGYPDGLELVDQTVAQLVEHLDSNSVLILSADHPLRNADQLDGVTDPHVPFIVHFPGQTKPLWEEQEFSALRTAPFILQILDGKVRTPEDADEFLEAEFRSTGPSTH